MPRTPSAVVPAAPIEKDRAAFVHVFYIRGLIHALYVLLK